MNTVNCSGKHQIVINRELIKSVGVVLLVDQATGSIENEQRVDHVDICSIAAGVLIVWVDIESVPKTNSGLLLPFKVS